MLPGYTQALESSCRAWEAVHEGSNAAPPIALGTLQRTTHYRENSLLGSVVAAQVGLVCATLVCVTKLCNSLTGSKENLNGLQLQIVRRID